MLILRIRPAATVLVAALVSSATGPLHVLRVTPATPADPLDAVTVTFDRPVAGGLDATVSAASIFSIEPAVHGTVEWRDPVTLRFTPDAPFRPGATYTVNISASFNAMDGSRLDGDFHYSFQVSPPRVLGGSPVGRHRSPRYLATRPMFSLLLSAETDVDTLMREVSVHVGGACGGGMVDVRSVGPVHRIGPDDDQSFRYMGIRGPALRDSTRDLRRVVDLTPLTPLGGACADTLVVPQVVTRSDQVYRWPFSVHGLLRLAGATCGFSRNCPTGPVDLHFTTPVRGADVMRHVRIEPATPFTISDTSALRAEWSLSATLTPRRRYTVSVDSTLVDAFGQRIGGPLMGDVATTGYAPSVSYEYGLMTVERRGLGTLAVQHVNADTLVVSTLAVPDSMEAAFLANRWTWGAQWSRAAALVREDTLVVQGGEDQRRFAGIRLGVPPRRAAPGGSLLAVKVSSPSLDSVAKSSRPIALVQVTDLAVTARVGVGEAAVWVTSVHDGTARSDVLVTLHDDKGRVLATGRTNAEGIAVLRDFRVYEDACEGWRCDDFQGYVSAKLGDDRAVVGISAYDPDLSPWDFDVYPAWGEDRAPVAAALFTDRGIYRPGEAVHAKVIVRRGMLGALSAPRGDSVRWLFHDRDKGILLDTVARLSDFGTADRQLTLPAGLPLGRYRVEAEVQRAGKWRTAATSWYRVAEYRPPEFLVDVVGEEGARVAGDSASFHVSARYLFGAPMGHAPVKWTVERRPVFPWELDIPGADGYQVGLAWSWEDDETNEGAEVVASGADSLDASGSWSRRIALPKPEGGRPARVTFAATVTDANRQIGSGSASVLVHPAAFYLGAKAKGKGYFWTAGTPVGIDVVALRPDGAHVKDVAVTGTVVRREWHRVRRERDGAVEEVGGWVADTVATCALRTAAAPVSCDFTPPDGGSYTVLFTARDEAGRTVQTSLGRWATGKGWVPWNDESQFKMDVIPDRARYTVGDTATVFFASPFTDAEAWITVEREGIIQQRRIRITSGATTLKFPVTEAWVPNVFVGIVVVRGRSAPPGPLDDPGRPTLRVGYAELRVTPEVKRLTVDVTPERPAYRPGDSASFDVHVRDRAGRGRRSEVTLWAVDEGVLALTGYKTPDPIDLLYPARGLGMRLASNLVSVAPQIPQGEKGGRSPGGGGGADVTGILRSRFRSTAFFLASVVTDSSGHATAGARLPDNVTTYRVMAVAVTTGDRYGSGESKLLVTRPLVARPALPRFVRDGDRFRAGVVVNSRMGGTPKVQVKAHARGIELTGPSKRSSRLAEGRGADVRFDFHAVSGDSARFRFDASSGKEADAVAVAVPVRPSYYPLTRTVSGVLHDTASVAIALQEDVDPRRSQVEISLGSSVLAAIGSARARLSVYPYDCTEQVSSAALPLIALTEAQALHPGDSIAPPDVQTRIGRAVRVILSRQRSDGAIGYWGADDWSSPWLSAYAGRVLLEARTAGVAVPDSALARLAAYMVRALHDPTQALAHSPLTDVWLSQLPLRLGEELEAADYLSRAGQPDLAAENTLLGQASRLSWEDRVLLAEVLARDHRIGEARPVLDAALRAVTVAGRQAVLPDSAGLRFYFASRSRPAARLLEALLTIEPGSPLVGPLVERLVDQGRVDATRPWNTQDYGSLVMALLRYDRARSQQPPSRVRVRAGRRTLMNARTTGSVPADTVASLQGLVAAAKGGLPPGLRLDLSSSGGGTVYYFITVREAPRSVQLTPVDRGIQVERWYESATSGKPVVEAEEGALVRVRLRVHVSALSTFVVLDDPLPAGLEPVDLTLRTLSPFGASVPTPGDIETRTGWYYGSWDSGMWSPFDHKELRDDRVVYSATVLWPGVYTATYLARATTEGTFLYPPAHAEEMYNPGVNGRSGGGTFTVRAPGG